MAREMVSPQKPQISGGESVIFLTNALAPSMLLCQKVDIQIERVTAEMAKMALQGKKAYSYIGHELTAKALSLLLGIEVPVNRSTLKVTSAELLIFSLNARLPEGYVVKSQYELEQIGYSLYHAVIKCMP